MRRRRFAYFIRTGDDGRAESNLGFTIAMTLGVMAIEDIPQLVINCIYLDSAGFGGTTNGVAVFSFAMSLISITCNLVLLKYEHGKLAQAEARGAKIYTNPVTGWGAADRNVHSYANPSYDTNRR